MSTPFATLTMVKVPFYKPAMDCWPVFEEFAKEGPLTIFDKTIELKIVEENDITKGLSTYGIKPFPPILYKHESTGRSVKFESYPSRDALIIFLTEQIQKDL